MADVIRLDTTHRAHVLDAAPRLRWRPLVWLALRRERQALRNLDAHLLADLGISAADASREAARPFWDVPSMRG